MNRKEKKIRIVLASASPRRKELMEQIGMDFEIVVSDVEEKVTSVIPCDVVEELARQKAMGVWETLKKQEETALSQEALLVIGADTIVACDGRILGKPKGAEDAKQMLRLLQGRSHEVYTGVTVLYAAGNGCAVQKRTFHETTKVMFCAMSEEEIESYVATGDPLDKAGSYGIQGLCARYIRGIEGDYNNVVGLPVGRLYQEMKSWLN